MKTKFDVFGEPVEMMVLSEQTGGAFSIGRQTCVPGSGTPPHMHLNEDEVFSVVSGRFEVYNGDNDTWTEVPKDGVVFAPRGHVHCFRNCGDAPGTIQFVCGGNTFDTFLEGLSAYTVPDQIQEVVDYSIKFGISYPTMPPPTKVAELVDVTA